MLTESLKIPAFQKEAFLLSQSYLQNNPFPHIVLDDFLDDLSINCLRHEFRNLDENGWLHYRHFNAHLSAFPHRKSFSDGTQKIIELFSSQEFIQWLEVLTGIKGLRSDPEIEGGGFVSAPRAGFLNMHADFTVHPHRPNWRRRVNLLLYLNEDWKPGFGGELQLWDQKMQNCEQKILPLLNRCVIFNTDENSFHGYPDPICCPAGESRKNLALYYYTESKSPIVVAPTNYRARPHDGMKKVGIFLDKKMLHGYDWMKRYFGISDGFASKLMSLGTKSKVQTPKN